uniref:General transcription factor IIA, 1 n=1 Tax=Petromyzon marinus TaxID=7757 RepID=S4RL05_PETMA
ISATGRADPAPKLYTAVIEDVVQNLKDIFLDEGVDEHVLQELKQLWESKLMQSKALESLQQQENLMIARAQQPHPQNKKPSPTVAVVRPQTTAAGVLPDQRNVQMTTTTVVSAEKSFSSHNGMFAATPVATMTLPTGVISPFQVTALSQGMIGRMPVVVSQGGQQIVSPQFLQHIQQMQQFQQVPQMQQGAVEAPPFMQQGQSGQPGQLQILQQLPPVCVNVQMLWLHTHTQVSQLEATLPQQPTVLQLQQVSQAQTQGQTPPPVIIQVDGAGDTSSEDDYDEEEEDKDKDDDLGEEAEHVEEEPLNSEDDVSDEEGTELFETDNVVVCQYDKIHRSKNKWKFHLKDGIMNLNGRDFVFSRATGDAEW